MVRFLVSEVTLYPLNRGILDVAVRNQDELYRVAHYRGTSLIRNSPPLYDHHTSLGIVLLKGPRGALFPMSEVPKWAHMHLP